MIKIDLSGVSTARPNLVPGDYVGVLASAKMEPNRDKTGYNLVAQFTIPVGTSTAAQAEGKEDDLANYKLTKYYALQQSSNSKAPDFRVDLKRLVEAMGIEGDIELNDELLATLVDKQVVINVGMSKATDTYPEQSEIKRLTALKQ